ncbi:MAG: DUF1800 domain-containing protein [Acidobacteria bacterium]|uniref:DUF1800 domain-containing protein n=1 Tax=Candidatus Polarisedimenticola svalbardensis TaxID=2886004 RepID=A0A8J6Y8D6_9BACT|nr:DUF1800 domain-containing protein [Candidatus Polarisedimenticola svalbardensis]
MRSHRTFTFPITLVAVILFATVLTVQAQVPGEVANLGFTDVNNLVWDADPASDDYNVYRGRISDLNGGRPPACHGNEIGSANFGTPAVPPSGEAWAYLVTGESDTAGEGPSGSPTLGGCDAVVENHLLNRIGFGWNEYVRDRVAVLGLQGFVDEQLDPASIDESDNTLLTSALSPIEPPDNLSELQGISLVNAVYSRHQLERAATLFWLNHFNNDYSKLRPIFNVYADGARRNLETVTLLYQEMEEFRNFAFNGSFRDILEASALSPPMIVYLDTHLSKAGKPNENYAREVLELHTQGVNGGYTHHEIDQLARIFTGWSVCKHHRTQVTVPNGVCAPRSSLDTPDEWVGEWVRHFTLANHDCEEKVLFQGTAYEAVIPDTCDYTDPLNPVPTIAGMNDVYLALDALADHPSTATFISTKLLQRFVTETPTQAMVDAVVAEWNNTGNPAGRGDLREVLRAVLNLAEARDPDFIAGKVKDPFEHVASAFRATRGKTNGYSTVRNYLVRMQHLYHQNPVPTGWPEMGGDWLDTNNLLERQNFALDMTSRTGSTFGTDLITLLTDNGVSTAQGNADGIVDFFADALYGGALTPVERQRAIDYLNTDDNGVVSNYTNARIRETVGFMMGFAQYTEQ